MSDGAGRDRAAAGPARAVSATAPSRVRSSRRPRCRPSRTAASQSRPETSTVVEGEEYGDHWPAACTAWPQRVVPAPVCRETSSPRAVTAVSQSRPSPARVRAGLEVCDQVRGRPRGTGSRAGRGPVRARLRGCRAASRRRSRDGRGRRWRRRERRASTTTRARPTGRAGPSGRRARGVPADQVAGGRDGQQLHAAVPVEGERGRRGRRPGTALDRPRMRPPVGDATGVRGEHAAVGRHRGDPGTARGCPRRSRAPRSTTRRRAEPRWTGRADVVVTVRSPCAEIRADQVPPPGAAVVAAARVEPRLGSGATSARWR